MQLSRDVVASFRAPCVALPGMRTDSPRDISTGPEIRAARKDAGLTQDALARAVGVTRPTIMRWETGRTTPGRMARQALSRVFGLDTVFDADERVLLGLASFSDDEKAALVAALRAHRGRQQAG